MQFTCLVSCRLIAEAAPKTIHEITRIGTKLFVLVRVISWIVLSGSFLLDQKDSKHETTENWVLGQLAIAVQAGNEIVATLRVPRTEPYTQLGVLVVAARGMVAPAAHNKLESSFGGS